MKSRVQKNQDLHQSLATNSEKNLESSSLSQFADRLNQIDDQFKKMESSFHEEHEPQRARVLEETRETNVNSDTTSFDTFENTYLKDFLDEVKDYNVKRGFTKETDNTHEVFEKSVSPVDSEAIQSVLDEINQYDESSRANIDSLFELEHQPIEAKPEISEPEVSTQLPEQEDSELDFLADISNSSYEEDVEATRVFNLDYLNQEQNETIEAEKPLHSETLSISDAVKEMAEEPIVQDDVYGDLEIEDDLEMEVYESVDLPVESFSFDDDKFKQELLEQTQTLQHKIIDQERNIDEMNETMVRTNRMLNVVLSLLLLAVVVVLILIFSYYF